MCIRKTLIQNRKYTSTKKNGGIVPVCRDKRQLNIYVPCGQCYICRKKKAREWRMRISEDIKVNKDCKIVTLTFNTESLQKIAKQWCKGYKGYNLDNEICRQAVKHFRERWRKEYGRSPRHWLITELGHGETEHVHMHGIIWEDSRYKLKKKLVDEVEEMWAYGFVGKGKKNELTGEMENYVDASTANYFTKYVNKIDEMHPNYKQIILTSAGIGKAYIGSAKAKDNIYKGKDTNQMYTLDNGGKLPMPEYFRKKLWTEEQREKLTGWYLDKETIYIDGKQIPLSIGDVEIGKMYKKLREKNAKLGFTKHRSITQKIYERQRRKEIHKKRFEGEEKAIRAKHVSMQELRNSTEDWVILRQRQFELERGEENRGGGTNNGGLPRGSSVETNRWLVEPKFPDWVTKTGEELLYEKHDGMLRPNESFYEQEDKEIYDIIIRNTNCSEISGKDNIIEYHRYNTPKGKYTIKAENEARSREKIAEIMGHKGMTGVKYVK